MNTNLSDKTVANEGLGFMGTAFMIGFIYPLIREYLKNRKLNKNPKEVAKEIDYKELEKVKGDIELAYKKYTNVPNIASKIANDIISLDPEKKYIKEITTYGKDDLDSKEEFEKNYFTSLKHLGIDILHKKVKENMGFYIIKGDDVYLNVLNTVGWIDLLDEINEGDYDDIYAEIINKLEIFNDRSKDYQFNVEYSDGLGLEVFINAGIKLYAIKSLFINIEKEASQVKNGSESFLTELSSTYFENTNVQFRPDTDLGHINNALVSNLSLTMPSGLDEEEQTQVMVEHIDTYLQSEEGMNYFENIKMYSEMFSEKINDAFSTLKNKVTPEVQTLTEAIENRRNEIVNRVTHMVDIDGAFVEKDPQFTIVDLEKFRTEESFNNAQYLANKYFDSKITKVSVSTLKYFADNISILEDIKLSDEEMDNYTSTISEVIDSDPSSDKSELKASIYQAIKPVFNKYEFNKLKRLIINEDIKSGKINEDAISNAYAFSKLTPIFTNLDRIVDIDNEEVLKTFKSNIESINDLYRLATVLLVLANEKYENCTIIGKTMLNQTGLAKVEANGGTLQDIDKFIRLNYNDDKTDVIYSEVSHMNIPNIGVSSDTIIKNLDITRTKYANLEAKIKNQHKSIVNTASKQAYEEVLKEYVNDIEVNHSELISNTSGRQFSINAYRLISHLAYNLVRFDTNNLTDSVYEFYLNTWYGSSLVSNVYHKLGTELISVINNSEVIDEDTAKYAHFTVMSDILSEYITKTMIIPSK